MIDREEDLHKREVRIYRGLTLTVDSYKDSSTLHPETRAAMVDQLTPLTSRGFLRDNPQESRPGVESHVLRSKRIVIVKNTSDDPLAFLLGNTVLFEGKEFYLLEGIIIDETLRGSGLGYDLISEELKQTGSGGMILRTQSILMLGLARKLIEADRELATRVAQEMYTKNLEGDVQRRIYNGGKCLYGDVERFSSQAIDWINWREGDGLIVAGLVREGDILGPE